MRVRLVVFEHHIEVRLVLFDEVRFKHQRLDLVIDDDKLEIRNSFYKTSCFGVLVAAGLKILPHTAAQIFRLTDVNYFAISALVKIYAGFNGQCFEFFFECHYWKF